MTTPLIILAILFLPTLMAVIIGRLVGRPGFYRLVGRIAFAMAFAFFAVGHFVKTDSMAAMLPSFVPQKTMIIYATGVLEALLAIGLLVPFLRKQAGLACIAVLVLFFPANIYAALNGAGLGGHQWGPVYLAVRAPLQILLIVWGYWFVVRDVPDGSKQTSSIL
ncbi:hypothetical protein [Parasphingorhabdus sp.]|uniref:DoxX family protein n=1 Tax=Parasphingorhabdus sp. TaxID=2709688 RepID=UPI003A94EFE8